MQGASIVPKFQGTPIAAPLLHCGRKQRTLQRSTAIGGEWEKACSVSLRAGRKSPLYPPCDLLFRA
jgi:hypothetical protein